MSRYGLRMRLARFIAPAAIMVDPYPGEDGVFVVYRKSDDGYDLQWSIRADRFRLKSSRRLVKLDLDATDPWPTYRPRSTFTRFVGTVGSR